MFKWYRELLEIRHEFRERQLKLKIDANVCESCEVLKAALEHANYEREHLLNRLLQSTTVDNTAKEPPQISQVKKQVPWVVKQQQLEAADREKAKARLLADEAKEQHRIIREFDKNLDKHKLVNGMDDPSPAHVQSLEKELGIK